MSFSFFCGFVRRTRYKVCVSTGICNTSDIPFAIRLIISAFPFSRRMQRNWNDQPDTALTDPRSQSVCHGLSIHPCIFSPIAIFHTVQRQFYRTTVGQQHPSTDKSMLPLLLPEAYRISYSNALPQKKVSLCTPNRYHRN